jgi:hypothetical protein
MSARTHCASSLSPAPTIGLIKAAFTTSARRGDLPRRPSYFPPGRDDFHVVRNFSLLLSELDSETLKCPLGRDDFHVVRNFSLLLSKLDSEELGRPRILGRRRIWDMRNRTTWKSSLPSTSRYQMPGRPRRAFGSEALPSSLSIANIQTVFGCSHSSSLAA